MKTKTRNVIYTAAFVIVVVIGLIYKLFLSGRTDGIYFSSNESDASDASLFVTESESRPLMISVYICGAVEEPGVYEVPGGSILNDVVVMSGGLTEEAARENIDLVKILNENVSVYIPTEDEIDEGYSSAITIGAVTVVQESSSGLININSGSLQELMTLPGIGEATAEAIISYREQTPFEKTEDIMNVSGIGESKYGKIKDLICV
ncbi:MAG TPA: competence protein ComEA [Clostridiales bacterium]|nr:competence protein ComEA [Clostridiales bacterium]